MIKISELLFTIYNFTVNKIFKIGRKHVFLRILSSGEMMKVYSCAKKYANENDLSADSQEYDFYMNLFLLLFSVTRLNGKRLFSSVEQAANMLTINQVSRIILLYSHLERKVGDKMLIKSTDFEEECSCWDYNESYVDSYE